MSSSGTRRGADAILPEDGRVSDDGPADNGSIGGRGGNSPPDDVADAAVVATANKSHFPDFAVAERRAHKECEEMSVSRVCRLNHCCFTTNILLHRPFSLFNTTIQKVESDKSATRPLIS